MPPRVTPVVLNLLILNGLMFAVINLLQPHETLYMLFKPNWLGQHPVMMHEGLPYYGQLQGFGPFGPGDFRPVQLVLHFFSHQSLFHFLGNMLALFSIGTAVEAVMGSRRFLEFYLFCGLAGGLAVAALDPTVNPVIGASGAIAGVLVAMALYFPKAELILFPIPLPIKVRTVAVGMFVLSLVFVITGGGGPVSHFGHLAGMVAGLLYFFGRRFLPKV